MADQGRLDVGQGVADRLGAAKGDDRHVPLRGDKSMERAALKGADRVAQGKHLRPIARSTIGCQAAMAQVVPGPQTETDRSGVTVDNDHGDCSFDMLHGNRGAEFTNSRTAGKGQLKLRKTVVRQAFQPDLVRFTVRLESLTYNSSDILAASLAKRKLPLPADQGLAIIRPTHRGRCRRAPLFQKVDARNEDVVRVFPQWIGGRSSAMPRRTWAAGALALGLIALAGCADNPMVLQGRVAQYQQQQSALQKQNELYQSRIDTLDKDNQRKEALWPSSSNKPSCWKTA